MAFFPCYNHFSQSCLKLFNFESSLFKQIHQRFEDRVGPLPDSITIAAQKYIRSGKGCTFVSINEWGVDGLCFHECCRCLDDICVIATLRSI